MALQEWYIGHFSLHTLVKYNISLITLPYVLHTIRGK